MDEYIGSFPKDVQTTLRTVRRTIRDAVPGAEESISYQMPTYKLQGRGLIAFAAFKNHYSLFGDTRGVLRAFGKELSRYEGTGKGTLRFPLDEPVPVKLIGDIVRYRAKNLGRAGKKK